MTGILNIRDGFIRKADFGFELTHPYITTKHYNRGSFRVDISDDGKSLHCVYDSYHLVADISADGHMIVSRQKDGNNIILKDAFVSIPGTMLNGVFTLRTDNKVYVNFLCSSFSDYIYSHNILGALYGEPNGDFYFRANEQVVTDGEITLVCAEEDGSSFMRIAHATYLWKSSSWTENGVQTYKSQLYSLINPCKLDLSLIDEDND